MDQFTYGYGTTSNRLLNVADAAGATTNTDDIEPGQVANNYQYDLLGQLTKDIQEGIVNYDWRLSDRKLRSITGVSTKPDVNFIYNPFGQRVVKIVKPKVNGVVDKQSNWIYTYYSYDANGQVMAVYDCKLDATNAALNKATLKEQHLYGSQRLGMVNKNTLLYQSNTAFTAISPLVQNTYGNTKYELNNHLGNVNAVITDRRYWNTTTLKYEAVVEMKKDYYPFGMEMPGRTFNSDSYRYGYNGMELDNEVSGNGNSYTTEFRQYDPRLGRWKSLDPLAHLLTDQSPYSFALNSPVRVVDGDGRFPIFINGDADEISEGSSHYWEGIQNKMHNNTKYKMLVNSKGKPKQVSGPVNSQWSGDFLFVNGNRGKFASTRRTMGALQAKSDADDIWDKLKKTMKNGQITEQIQMVSHSRGVAFAEGYIESITKEIQARAEKEGIGFSYNKNSIVEYHIGLAPHQSDFLHAGSSGTKSVYVTHYGDILSDNDASGHVINVSSTSPTSNSHLPSSFNREFDFILNVLKNGGGTVRIREWYKLFDKNTGSSSDIKKGTKKGKLDCEKF